MGWNRKKLENKSGSNWGAKKIQGSPMKSIQRWEIRPKIVKEGGNRIIIPVDKNNAPVIVVMKQYKYKMNKTLDEGLYRRVENPQEEMLHKLPTQWNPLIALRAVLADAWLNLILGLSCYTDS